MKMAVGADCYDYSMAKLAEMEKKSESSSDADLCENKFIIDMSSVRFKMISRMLDKVFPFIIYDSYVMNHNLWIISLNRLMLSDDELCYFPQELLGNFDMW